MQAKAVADGCLVSSQVSCGTQEDLQDTSIQPLLHTFHKQENEFVATAVHTCYAP